MLIRFYSKDRKNNGTFLPNRIGILMILSILPMPVCEASIEASLPKVIFAEIGNDQSIPGGISKIYSK